MTASEAAYAGERRWRQTDNAGDRDEVDPPLRSHGVAGGGAIDVTTRVPMLDWPFDLFADVVVGDDDMGGELMRRDRTRVTMGEPVDNRTAVASFGDVTHGTVIWRRQSARGTALLEVAP